VTSASLARQIDWRALTSSERNGAISSQQVHGRKLVGLLRDDPQIRADVFADMYLLYREAILALCARRLGDPVLAEDVVQDTFLRAFQSLDKFDWQKPMFPWLAVIATRRCIDVCRRGDHNRRLAVETHSPTLDDRVLAPLETESDVEDAVQRLPLAQRKVLLLRAHHGLSLAEIAEVQGTTTVVVKGLLQRARESMRRALRIHASSN
jgi:RNA polymerase sigma factor (sigma-70 family)